MFCPVAGIVSVTVPYIEVYSCEPVFTQVGATYVPIVQTALSVSFGNVIVSLWLLSLPQTLSAAPVSVFVGSVVILQAPQLCPVAGIVSVTVPYIDVYSCEPVFSQVGATYVPIVQTALSVSFGNVIVSLWLLSLPQTLSAAPVSVFVGSVVILQAPQLCPVAGIVSVTVPYSDIYVCEPFGIVKICAVKKYPKFDFATYRTSIAVTTINSFLEFCQGRRRRLF